VTFANLNLCVVNVRQNLADVASMRVLARAIKLPPREAVRGDIPEPPEGAQLMMLYEEAGRTTFKRITKSSGSDRRRWAAPMYLRSIKFILPK